MDELKIVPTEGTRLLADLHDAAVPEIEFVFASRTPTLDDIVLVAWVGAEPAGYVAASSNERGGVDVWEHAVVPHHRHRGVGRALLRDLAGRISSESTVRVDPAHQLDAERVADYYRRCGFEHIASGDVWGTAREILQANPLIVEAGPGAPGTPVKTLLRAKSAQLVTVRPGDGIRHAVEVLAEHSIGAVVVSDDGVRLRGILSERDVLRALRHDGDAVLDRTVGELMTTEVVTARLDDSMTHLMTVMTNGRFRHLPIFSGHRLIGIVSIGDLVRHRLHEVEAENAQIHEYIATGR